MDTGNSVTDRVEITDMIINNATSSSGIAETTSTTDGQGKTANYTRELSVKFPVIIFISINIII